MPEVWKKWEGQVVNEKFRLLRYLGSSDHSAVFLTERPEREPREVAIKLVSANAENPELQLSWWELASKLSHPNLLRLFERGRCQIDGLELLYTVTESADESLSQILPDRPLSPSEARDTLQPLLDALAYLHAKGFVHGHIKPANILAVGDQIKLSSDELCGAGESSRVLRAPDIYAAPEIADGGGMTSASDVWSLGMTLVEALTQHPPTWRGPEQAELVLPDTLPEPFFDIASHCLRRDPHQRWTVAEIAARLQRSSPAPEVEQAATLAETPHRRSYLFPAIAAGVLLLAILSPRLFHRNTSPQPESASSVEPSNQASIPNQGSGTTPPATVASDESQHVSSPVAPSPAPHATGKAKNNSKKNAASSNAATGNQVKGEVVQQVPPDVSRSALRTIHGKVKVRITAEVDSSGKVVQTKFDSHGPSKYFADRTVEAAKQWTFKPPQVGGQSVPSQWSLKFEFTRGGSNVFPAQTSP